MFCFKALLTACWVWSCVDGLGIEASWCLVGLVLAAVLEKRRPSTRLRKRCARHRFLIIDSIV